jgi:hypothetical protein
VALINELENLCKTRFGMFLDSKTSFLEFAVDQDLVWYIDSRLDSQLELGSHGSSRLPCRIL